MTNGSDIILDSAATRQPLMLRTTEAHAHMVTAACPVACLDGLLSNHALNALLREPVSRGTVGDVVELYRQRQLGELRGIGVGRIAEIEEVLQAGGFISEEECYVRAASAPMARSELRWVTAINGPMVRDLRYAHGFSQSLLARLTGLCISTVARLEDQAAPFCHRQTLDRLASILGVPAATLERSPAGQV